MNTQDPHFSGEPAIPEPVIRTPLPIWSILIGLVLLVMAMGMIAVYLGSRVNNKLGMRGALVVTIPAGHTVWMFGGAESGISEIHYTWDTLFGNKSNPGRCELSDQTWNEKLTSEEVERKFGHGAVLIDSRDHGSSGMGFSGGQFEIKTQLLAVRVKSGQLACMTRTLGTVRQDGRQPRYFEFLSWCGDPKTIGPTRYLSCSGISTTVTPIGGQMINLRASFGSTGGTIFQENGKYIDPEDDARKNGRWLPPPLGGPQPPPTSATPKP